MFKKVCRCGKSTKNFKFNIGPFYIADCCVAAGFDHLGKKKDLAPEELGLTKDDASEIEQAQLEDDTTPEPEDPNEETNPTPEQVKAHKEELEKNPPDTKKRRSYNRGGNLKKES